MTDFSDSRLDSLYVGDGFGGGTSMRARVVRSLIEEIRDLRRQLADAKAGPFPADPPAGAVGG